MAALSDSYFSFITIFDKSATPKNLIVRDTTDQTVLTNLGYTLTGLFIKAVYTYSGGSQVLYDNLDGNVTGGVPDITPPATDSTASIPIPLQSDGNLAFGTYTVTVRFAYEDTSTDPATEYTNDISHECDYSWVPPTGSISYRVNLMESNITTIDTTSYGGLVLDMNRQHTITPPGPAQLPPLSLLPQTTTLATNVYVNITNGWWGAKVYNIVTYELDRDGALSGLQDPTTTGNACLLIEEYDFCVDIHVFSRVDLNKLLCCLFDIKTLYQDLKFEDRIAAENLKKQKLDPIERNLIFYIAAAQAGCEDKANEALDQIIKLSGCSGCTCDDDCPSIIPAILPATHLYDVDSPDFSITVTKEVIGNTTIFHLTVSPTIINQLANIKTYIVEGISPIVVTTTTSPDGKTITYTVSIEGGFPVLQNLAVVLVTIEYNPLTAVWDLVPEEIFVDEGGGVVNTFSDHIFEFVDSGTTSTTAVTDAFAFVYKNFFAANQKFVVRSEVISALYPEYYNISEADAKSLVKTLNFTESDVMWIEQDANDKGNSTIVRLYNPVQGKVLLVNNMAGVESEDVKFKIRLEVMAATS